MAKAAFWWGSSAITDVDRSWGPSALLARSPPACRPGSGVRVPDAGTETLPSRLIWGPTTDPWS